MLDISIKNVTPNRSLMFMNFNKIPIWQLYIYVYYFYIFLLSTSIVCILFTSRLSTLRGTQRDLEHELMVVNKVVEILIVNKLVVLS